jgi:protein gp37
MIRKAQRAKDALEKRGCKIIKIPNTGDQAAWHKDHSGTKKGHNLIVVSPGTDCTLTDECRSCRQILNAYIAAGGEEVPTTAITTHLCSPFRWSPTNVAVGLEGDLGHANIPEEFIISVGGVMYDCRRRHNFVVTTKRPNRLFRQFYHREMLNVFFGVSVGIVKSAWRLDELFKLPGGSRKVLFAAPLIEDISKSIPMDYLRGIDWLIITPEKGGDGWEAQPCPEEWLLNLIWRAREANPDLPIFLDTPHRYDRVMDLLGDYRERPAQLCGLPPAYD